MRILFLILIVLNTGLVSMAQAPRVYREVVDDVHSIFADNEAYSPASLQFSFSLNNMAFSEKEDKVFVVPPRSKKIKLGEIRRINPTNAYSLNYKFKYNTGDVTINSKDHSALYDLPFAKGRSYKIYQGYDGRLSHQNEKSLDFTMPEGTEIFAAREGVVVKLIESNSESCPSKDCIKYNNELIIMHPDGTFAAYVHLKQNGALFNVGDSVKQGDLIAYSGNTGWSTGPHLHFTCYIQTFDVRETLPTKFRINKGEQAVLLLEGSTYLRDY
ncbi:MAG: M23 family metallopeptidase [Chitinophagaceae bacterium]|nr:MAG: M23 family metallopeptidase [Chitinophagaceae bacterium]